MAGGSRRGCMEKPRAGWFNPSNLCGRPGCRRLLPCGVQRPCMGQSQGQGPQIMLASDSQLGSSGSWEWRPQQAVPACLHLGPAGQQAPGQDRALGAEGRLLSRNAHCGWRLARGAQSPSQAPLSIWLPPCPETSRWREAVGMPGQQPPASPTPLPKPSAWRARLWCRRG